MKKILYILVFIPIALLISILFSPQDKKVINHEVLKRQNIAYDRNSTTPFTGAVEIYYDNGQLKESSNYKNGKIVGKFEEYYDDGNLKKNYNYKNGMLNGLRIDCFHIGYDFFCDEEFFKNGKLHGPYKWFKNSKLSEKGIYKNDKRHGLSQTFFLRSGNLKSERIYKNGKTDGVYKYFFENGSLERFGTYTKNGDETGPFEIYNLKGEVIEKGYMKNSVRVEEKKPQLIK